jgi:PKD repeat protein
MASPDPCRNGGSAALVGMTFYAGTSYPARLHGALLFGDFSVGCLYAMLPDASGVPDPTKVEVIARGLPNVVSYESGPGGDLYYVSISTGELHQLRYVDHAPTSIATADITDGMSPLVVQLDGTGSIDPDGEALAYAWDLDDDGEFDDSTDPAPRWTFDSGLHHARLRVTDPDGQSDVSAPIAITVDDQPPVVTIDAPHATRVWHSGETITVAGSALDPEEGSLAPTRLHWQVTLFHCPGGGCHPHPFTAFDGASGSFVAVPDGFPAHFDITLTATDATGLTAHTTVTIEAARAEVTFTSDPPNIELRVGDEMITTPTTLGEVPGVTLELEAPETIALDDRTYVFAGWSDGLPRVHDVPVGEADTTFSAAYTVQGGPCEDCAGPAKPGGCSTGGGGGLAGCLALLGLRRRRR